MTFKKSKLVWIPTLAMLPMLLTACGGQQNAVQGESVKNEPKEEVKAEVSTDPVTIKLAISQGWLAAGELEKYIMDPVKKKYPHITIEVLNTSATALDKLVGSGQIPDVVMTASPLIHRFTSLELHDNMEPLIKKHKFDLTKLNQNAIESVKVASQLDYLAGIPWTMHFDALYYNKDLFDRFAVDYPKDGMTWEDAAELAKKLTRTDGGVKYRGLEPDFSHKPASTLGLALIDPKSERAIVNNDAWKNVFSLVKRIYDIPGNNDFKPGVPGQNQFFKDRTLAMVLGLNLLPNFKNSPDLNWDMVQYPQFKEVPNTSAQVDAWVMHVTKQSKNKDQAFQVIASIVSEEVQLDMARNARFPIMNSAAIRDQFGQDLAYLKGKNLKSAFLSQPAKAYATTVYGEEARKIIEAAMGPVVKGEQDINTALRDADEKINKAIDRLKGK